MATWLPQKFDRYADYQTAFLALIDSAEHSLVLHEDDFSVTGLDSRAAHDALMAFMLRNPAASVRLLARRAEWISAHCPRLLQLRETRGHQFSMRLMSDNSAPLPCPFGIADMQRIVRRIHFDWARGETSDDARESARALQAFEIAWETAILDSSWQRLGL